MICIPFIKMSLLCKQSSAAPELKLSTWRMWQRAVWSGYTSGDSHNEHWAMVKWSLAGENQRNVERTLLRYHFVPHKTNSLIPWSWVPLEKPPSCSATQELPNILWNPKIHYHWSLSQARSIQPTNLTWSQPILNSGLRDKKPESNRLSYDMTTLPLRWTASSHYRTLLFLLLVSTAPPDACSPLYTGFLKLCNSLDGNPSHCKLCTNIGQHRNS
jgi:hypothetical protein